MSAKQKLGDDLRALRGLAGVNLGVSEVKRSTQSDWEKGLRFPKTFEPIQKLVIDLRGRAERRVAARRLSERERHRLDELDMRHFATMYARTQMRGEAELDRLRELSKLASADAGVVIPSSPNARMDVSLERLYVRRDVEGALVEGLREPCAQVLVGDPGSGKTAVLWRLFNTVGGGSSRLEPFFLKATHLLPSSVGAATAQISVAEIVQALRFAVAADRKPVLLLDTLDLLMHSHEGQRAVARLLEAMREQQIAVVMTCRPGEATRLPWNDVDHDQSESDAARGTYFRPQLRLDVYSERERREAISTHSNAFCGSVRDEPGGVEQLISDLTGAVYRDLPLKEVCDSPLYLRMLFDLYAPHAPQADVDVVALFDLMREWRVIQDRRTGQDIAGPTARLDLEATAQGLARVMLAENALEYRRTDHGRLLGECLPDSSPQDIERDLAELQRRGLVVAIPGTAALRFFHQTFLEYMAADYLKTSGRAGELVDRLVEQPGDLVLAAVAGQLIPRLPAETAEKLLAKLLNTEPLADLGISLYAQLQDPAGVTQGARNALKSAPAAVAKDFLRRVASIRHQAPDRWNGDFETLWAATGRPDYAGAKGVRLQMLLHGLRRLSQQHPEQAVLFLGEEDRAGWLFRLSAQELSSHQQPLLSLLGGLFLADVDEALRWMTTLCRTYLAADKVDIAAAVPATARAQLELASDQGSPSITKRTLRAFERLLLETASSSQKAPYLPKLESEVGKLWAAAHREQDATRLVAQVQTVLGESMLLPLHRARLHGLGVLSLSLPQVAAVELMARFLDVQSPAAQQAVLDQVFVPLLEMLDEADSGARGGLRRPAHLALCAAVRSELKRLPCAAKTDDGLRSKPAWFVDALARADIKPLVLLDLLPSSPEAALWLRVDGLAALVGQAALASHAHAIEALETWGREPHPDQIVESSRARVRTSLAACGATHPLVLRALIRDAALFDTRRLSEAINQTAKMEWRVGEEEERLLRQLLKRLGDDPSDSVQLRRLRLLGPLVEHANWEPPPAAELLNSLASAEVTSAMYGSLLSLLFAASASPRWPEIEGGTARAKLEALWEAGTCPPPSHNNGKLFDSALVRLIARFGNVSGDSTACADTFDRLLQLIAPATPSDHQHTTVTLSEAGWFLKRVEQRDPAVAAELLLLLSERLSHDSAGWRGPLTDVANRLEELLSTLITSLGATARRRFVTAMARQEPLLGRKTVEMFGRLQDSALSNPPLWFRQLGEEPSLDPTVRATLNARLRIHARTQCTGPWPALLSPR